MVRRKFDYKHDVQQYGDLTSFLPQFITVMTTELN